MGNKSKVLIDHRLLLRLLSNFNGSIVDIAKCIGDKYNIKEYTYYDYGSIYVEISNKHEIGSIKLLADLTADCLRKIRSDCFCIDSHLYRDIFNEIEATDWDIKFINTSPVFWDVQYFNKSENESYNLEFMMKYSKFFVDEKKEILRGNFLGYLEREH